MRKKPLITQLASIFLFGLPFFGAFIVHTKLHGHYSTIPPEVWAQFTVLAFACWAAAAGVWMVRKWGYYTFFAFVGVIVAFDLFQVMDDGRIANNWYIADGLLVLIGVGLFRLRRTYEPYFNPQIRWWDPAKRYKADLTAHISNKEKTFLGKILDISETGCFIHLTPQPEVGQIFNFDLSFEDIHTQAIVSVVRNSQNPFGSGLMFVLSSRAEKKSMKKLIRSLRKIATLREPHEDETDYLEKRSSANPKDRIA